MNNKLLKTTLAICCAFNHDVHGPTDDISFQPLPTKSDISVHLAMLIPTSFSIDFNS